MKDMPSHAVPARPVAGPLARNTPGSWNPLGHGVRSIPHDGVCRMRLSVTVPVLSGGVDVLIRNRLTGTFVSPTTTEAG